MKFTPEVLAALATLREHADSDFERHRINVLEHDLTAPPTVEVIDDTHQKFLGTVYPKNKAGHFAKSYNPIHRQIYHYFFGDIPDDYEIHHRDGNKSNNNPGNLQCLTKAEHRRLHFSKAELVADFQQELICDYCGKTFTAVWSGGNRFCSAECKTAWHYRCENNQEERVCAYCGSHFKTSKYNATRCCSQSCAMKLRLSTKTISATCPICGKEFMKAPKSNKIYCSSNCTREAQNQKRYQKKN